MNIHLPILLDGATGSNLAARGMPFGTSMEEWILENPQELLSLQREYIEAGADILYAPTFSANRIKLAQFGLAEKTADFNRRLVTLTREAAQGKAKVAGVLSLTGKYADPYEELPFREMTEAYKEQAAALHEAGVDLFVVETMVSLAEMRAAVLACRKYHKPIFVTMTTDEHGETIAGATALSCLISLQGMGITAFGVNCSDGPQAMEKILRSLAPYAHIPLIAKPSAGQPDESGDSRLSPKAMAQEMLALLENGVQIAGGCCGSTPAHIAALRRTLDDFDFSSVAVEKQDTGLVLANGEQVFFLSADGIESSEPLECSLDMADELVELCNETSIDVITIELLTPEDAYLFSQNAHMAQLPVMFRSESVPALKAALLSYHGRAMLDSSCEIPEEELRTIARKYGAVVY